MTVFSLSNPTPFEAGLADAMRALPHDQAERQAAFARFARTGMPHRRLEAWKWTDMRVALSEPLTTDGSAITAPSAFQGAGFFTITFDETGAHWAGEVPAGVTLRVTDEVSRLMPLAADEPMAALAQALTTETLVISVADHAAVHAPVHLFRTGLGGDTHRRVLISLGQGANLTLMDSLETSGAQSFFDNLLVECRLAPGAHLTRLGYSRAGACGVDNALYTVEADTDAVFEQYVLARGGKRSRLETRLHFQGSGAQATLLGVSMLGGRLHGDLTTHIIHDAPECMVEQRHKSVLKDQANGVFQGKFLVERAGQKADANMQANALLLSEGATINHKPELEIYADDVQCAHGSTAGALDDEALFYLRQRGLTAQMARALLVEAFLGEVFDAVPVDAVADFFRSEMTGWLAVETKA
ncbi:MAG: SufD family Fe-S cluster assembly protein [Pseudomonadota bacterium]